MSAPYCPCCGSPTVLVRDVASFEPGYYCIDWYTRGDHEGCEFDDPIPAEA